MDVTRPKIETENDALSLLGISLEEYSRHVVRIAADTYESVAKSHGLGKDPFDMRYVADKESLWREKGFAWWLSMQRGAEPDDTKSISKAMASLSAAAEKSWERLGTAKRDMQIRIYLEQWPDSCSHFWRWMRNVLLLNAEVRRIYKDDLDIVATHLKFIDDEAGNEFYKRYNAWFDKQARESGRQRMRATVKAREKEMIMMEIMKCLTNRNYKFIEAGREKFTFANISASVHAVALKHRAVSKERSWRAAFYNWQKGDGREYAQEMRKAAYARARTRNKITKPV